ncbi:MAG: hypothetical protein FWE98_01090 [Oscillospiraceae bacterium]|nr:hypothetical protein [Oscillospiraceae bacterium]
MKRILVLLLALAMIVTVFAACKKTPDPDPTPTTEPVVVDITDPDDEITTEPGDEITTEPGDEVTTEPPADVTTEAPTGDVTEAPDALTPDKMNKEQLVAYYNEAINKVRSDKPGYTRVEVLKINKLTTTFVGGALDGPLNKVVESQMPGNPETKTKNKGDSNVDHFYIDQQTSQVRASDVATATAKKEGDNYVITLTLGNETNPEKTMSSKYYRMFFIQTRKELLDSLAEDGLTAEVSNCLLTYKNGKSVITVNDKGQIIKAHGEFFVDADAKKAKLLIFNFDVLAYQSSTWDYDKFAW